MPSIHFSHFALHCPVGIVFLLFLLFQHIYHNHTSHYFSSNPHFCSLFTSLFPHSYSPKLSWTLLPIRVPWSSTISSSLVTFFSTWFSLCLLLPSPCSLTLPEVFYPLTSLSIHHQPLLFVYYPPSFISNFFFSSRCHSPMGFFIPHILPFSPHPSPPLSPLFVSPTCWHDFHFLFNTSVHSFLC